MEHQQFDQWIGGDPRLQLLKRNRAPSGARNLMCMCRTFVVADIGWTRPRVVLLVVLSSLVISLSSSLLCHHGNHTHAATPILTQRGANRAIIMMHSRI